MAVHVSSYAFSNVGRMYARQNVPSVYGKHQAAANVDAEEVGQARDSVTLSSQAPRPLTADFLEHSLCDLWWTE